MGHHALACSDGRPDSDSINVARNADGREDRAGHHEKWDGTGYPNGIAGDLIPLEARICSIVDFYDALTMDRPYRVAFPHEQALDMMREIEGRHFDPEVLAAFFQTLDDIRAVQATHP